MNERRDRRRTFHRIRQPDMQGEHRTLAHTAHEHQGQAPGDSAATQEARRDHSLKVGIADGGQAFDQREEIKRPGFISQHQDADEESQVGEAGDDKGLLRGGDGRWLLVVISDEQKG